MSDTLLKHPIVTHQQEIQSICQPLKILDITYFSHVKIDKSKNFSFICNNPKFMEQYIKKQYYDADIHMADNRVLGNYIIWDAIEREGKTKQMEFDATQLGIHHTFTIIEKSKESHDYYHFSNGTNDTSINNKFMSNIDVLQHFIKYFNDKLAHEKLFINSHNIKFQPDYANGHYHFNDNLMKSPEESKKLTFINSLRINKDNFIDNKLLQILHHQFRNLTRRELEISVLMLKGRPGRVIAENLHLSSKTIEHYIDNLKNKLQVESKMELIGLLLDKISSEFIFNT